MYRKRYEYAKLDSHLPKEEELWNQGKTILKGYGFSDNEIFEEFNDKVTGFIVDLAGISGDRRTCVEVGMCGPEKLFALKSSFENVVWLPYWLTIIPQDKPESSEEIIELKGRIYELEQEIRNVEREFREINPIIELVCEQCERIKEKVKATIKNRFL